MGKTNPLGCLSAERKKTKLHGVAQSEVTYLWNQGTNLKTSRRKKLNLSALGVRASRKYLFSPWGKEQGRLGWLGSSIMSETPDLQATKLAETQAGVSNRTLAAYLYLIVGYKPVYTQFRLFLFLHLSCTSWGTTKCSKFIVEPKRPTVAVFRILLFGNKPAAAQILCHHHFDLWITPHH